MLARISADDVGDVTNVSSVEVPDAKVLKMVKRAGLTLEFEAGGSLKYRFKCGFCKLGLIWK